MRRALHLVLAVLAAAVLVLPAEAGTAPGAAAFAMDVPSDSVRVAPEVRSRLARPSSPGTAMRVEGITLSRGRTVSLDLEPFEIWAADAAILEHGSDGTRRLPIPADRYYSGTIAEEPGSLVFLAAGQTLRGLILSGDEVFAVAPAGSAWGPRSGSGETFVRRVDLEKERPAGLDEFFCGEESLVTPLAPSPRPTSRAQSVEALYTSTVYVATIAVETDYELYVKLGSSSSALTQYVGDLVAASSVIYRRDIQVKKQLGVLHIYTAGASSDPWTQTSTLLALYELGDYWHANYPLAGNPRSTVHLLSGKNGGGGIAWRSALCMADFLCGPSNCGSSSANGHYAGAYGVSSSLNGQFSTSNSSLYWDLLCFSHEIGHNFSSPHTHCYSPAVDTCCPCEPASASDCTGTVPVEKGTIMSYCHLRPGGYSNIKLYLAVPAESSVAVYNVMRTFVESLTCLPVDSPPTVTSVAPAQGTTAGGTSVVITGTNFVSGATVSFGGSVASFAIVGSATSIGASTPAHAAGLVNVVVTNPDLQAGTLANGFRYVPPPTVTSVSPAFGPAAGGTVVTITGTNFVATPAVTFGGSNATGEVWVSATTLRATAPAHAAGLVNVVVTNPDLQAGTLANGYYYGPAPAATKWYPLDPCRVVDTRLASGPLGGPVLSASQTRTFDVTTATPTCGSPSNAKALTVNYTLTDVMQSGDLRSFAGNAPWTGTSALSFRLGQTRANNGHLLLASDGSGTFQVTNASSGTVHFILDVNGYYR